MIDVNLDLLGRILGLSEPRKYLINLYDMLSQKVTLGKIKKDISKGFEKRFNVKFHKGTLTSSEKLTTKKLYELKYSKEDWNIRN